MTPEPIVSVIIPTYNRASTIAAAVESILGQTCAQIEVIVVDDGSQDDTARVMAALTDPRLRYVALPRNAGACAARNHGIELARADILAFQDSDDVWHPTKLERQLAVLGAARDRVIYCGFMRCEDGVAAYTPHSGIAPRRGRIVAPLLEGNFVSTQTLLVPRACLDAVGGFHETLGRLQDWELAIRLSGLYEFDLVDEPLVHAYMTPGNISSNLKAYVDAMETVLDLHGAVFDEYPQAGALIRCNLAHHLFALGRMGEGRGQLKMARALGHHRRTSAGLWSLSLLGAYLYRAVFKLVASGRWRWHARVTRRMIAKGLIPQSELPVRPAPAGGQPVHGKPGVSGC
ncbi:glycosyltransferase family 2 protein [Novosphingobium profundi]|uniref:glycosyltransferase family 2 protein n=1 Tax=Novosphingobium profundi TaxID=1774954 RepID=UPI001BDA4726|nr:glycosyltransferase family 2 protein [Novosphingobium profundi]MBT0666929.1 glycosyltransferase family 2 protein [Novosphingobium profundi]